MAKIQSLISNIQYMLEIIMLFFLLIRLRNIIGSLNSKSLKESSFRTRPDALSKPIQMDRI